MNIQNELPESPAELQVPKRSVGRPKGSRRLSPDSIQIDHVTYPHIPSKLWKQLNAVTSSFLATIGSQLEAAYADGVETKMVDLMDEALPDAALALGRATMEALAAQERGFRGSTIHCHICAGTLEYQGDVSKTLKTRIGDIRPKRSYYHGACSHSAVPLDMMLGVDGVHAVMRSLQDTLAWVAASMSYPETVKLLDRLCPSKFSLKAVETITTTVAKQVEKQLFVEGCQAFPPEEVESLQDGVAVVEVDGGFVLVRDHTESSREFKLAVIGRLAEGNPINCSARPGEVDKSVRLVEKTFVGHFADPDTVFGDIQSEYLRRGLHKLRTFHGISDGGTWIMRRMPFLLEEGQELSLVLDWWHADERLAEMANTLHGVGTDAAAKWRSAIQADLWHSHLDEFFAKLKQAINDAKPGARKALQVDCEYFVARRHLLRYQECRNRGLPIGSGAIEGGIRFVGKDRLSRTGMRWKIQGAEYVLQLRCVKCSHRWDELAAKRATKRKDYYCYAKTQWDKAA